MISRIGGDSEAALRRVGRFGDGWMAMPDSDAAVLTALENLAIIQPAASAAGRDLNCIGLQARLNDPLELECLTRRGLRAAGFTWTSVSLPSLEAAGLVGVSELGEALSRIRERLRRELG